MGMAEVELDVEGNIEVSHYASDEQGAVVVGMEDTKQEVGSEVGNGCTEPCVVGSTVVDTWGAASWAGSWSDIEAHDGDQKEAAAWATDVAHKDGGFAA